MFVTAFTKCIIIFNQFLLELSRQCSVSFCLIFRFCVTTSIVCFGFFCFVGLCTSLLGELFQLFLQLASHRICSLVYCVCVFHFNFVINICVPAICICFVLVRIIQLVSHDFSISFFVPNDPDDSLCFIICLLFVCDHVDCV